MSTILAMTTESIANENQGNRNLYTAVLTSAIVAVLVIIKTIAYKQSGAVSILTSLTDSLLDSCVSLMALGSIIYSQKPADEDHRWGHGKIEAFSALIQASIIVGGATFLVFESGIRLLEPRPIYQHWTGITVMIGSIFLSVLLVVIQRRTLKNSQSLIVESESIHYSSDVLINICTVVVLYANSHGAPIWLDSMFAICAAGIMVFMARSIFIKSLHVLLDRELPDADRDKIIAIIETHEGVLNWHDLRTRNHGELYDISFDIEVDKTLSLWDAHNITKDLERDIIKLFDKCDVMIHVDPKGYTEDERHRVKGVHM